MTDSSRRALLAGSGALAAGGLVGLSGCLDDIVESDDEETGDRNPLPSFHGWLYAPEAVGIGGYTYTYVDGEAALNPSEYGLASAPGFVAGTTGRITDMVPSMFDELGTDDVDGAVSIDHGSESGGAGGVAVAGGFDATELRSLYEDAAAEEDGVETDTYAGYDLYFDAEVAVAIDDGRFAIGFGDGTEETTARSIVEALVDARDGAASRLHQVDETADTLLRRQGEKTVVFGAPAIRGEAQNFFERSARSQDEADDDAHAIAGGGFTLEADDDRPTYRVTVITERAVSDADAFGDELPILDAFDEPSVSQDGVVITYEERGGDEATDGEGATSPEATFDVDVASDTVTIAHVSGDAIPADELEVIVSSSAGRYYTWAELGESGSVTAGDTITVDLRDDDAGGTVQLVWTPEGTLLADEPIPDESSGSPPSAAFEFEFDARADTATVRHAGGDAIPAAELEILVDGDDTRFLLWREFSTDDTVEPGDAVTIDLSEADFEGYLVVWWTVDNVDLDYTQIPDLS